METGTVKFFNETKGFGFITKDGTEEDYFVHKSNTKYMLRENDQVEFEIEKGPKGLNAVNVKVVK